MAEMAYYALSGFFDAISQVAKFSRRWDDDFCDRLNHRFSSLILVTMTVIVSYKQYVGEPIVCWCDGIWTGITSLTSLWVTPATYVLSQFKRNNWGANGAMVDYAHQICWVSNTYYLPRGTAPLKENEPRESVLVYYQWVPFILLAQAFLFQFPNIIWKGATQFIGLDLNRLARTVSGIENVNPEVRDRTVRAIVKQMDRSFAVSSWRSRGSYNNCLRKANLGCGRGFGNYLILLYIFCKLLYIGNSLGQIFALNYVLGAEGLGIHFLFYGAHIIKLTSAGHTPDYFPKVFPRVTMCDFTIRQMSNFHKYSIECALPINLFNEKIFIFMWFWLVLITLLNVLSLLFWISSIFVLSRTSYVKKYLIISEKMRRAPVERKHLPCFAERYLKQDGVFALRILSKNTNDVIVSEVVCKLWDHFVLHHSQRPEFHRSHTFEMDMEIAGDRYQNGRPNRLMSTQPSSAAVNTPTTPGNIFS